MSSELSRMFSLLCMIRAHGLVYRHGCFVSLLATVKMIFLGCPCSPSGADFQSSWLGMSICILLSTGLHCLALTRLTRQLAACCVAQADTPYP